MIYEWANKMLFLLQENKIHIFKPTCNALFIIWTNCGKLKQKRKLILVSFQCKLSNIPYKKRLHNTKNWIKLQTNVFIFLKILANRRLKLLGKLEEPPCFCRNKRQETGGKMFLGRARTSGTLLHNFFISSLVKIWKIRYDL